LARSALAVVALVVMLLQGTIGVLAGTTGSINGTVTEAQTNTPLANARVTVTSPSQQASGNTDASGRFAFLSLAPDTYTLTVTAPGHETITQAGITVQADQNLNLNLSAPKQLQRIGGTTARASTDLVKPGTIADVYSVNATQAQAAAGLGGGGALNSAYSAIASVPGVFVPQGQQGWAQSVYVRGGNYTQLGYEYDGVPVQRAYDAYPSTTLSALGQQEVQVYTGSQPGSAQSSGLAGFVNQVIKTGTFPGYGAAEGALGAPAFYHKAQIEFGGASPDRNFSYYLATAGYGQGIRSIDQFDGGGSQAYAAVLPIGAIAANCNTLQATAGCYNTLLGPSGILYTPISFVTEPLLTDRETVGNLHFGIPHKHDGLKDDVQALADISLLAWGYNDSFNALGQQAQQLMAGNGYTYNGVHYPDCNASGGANPCVLNLFPLVLGLPSGTTSYNYRNPGIYTGPVGGVLTTGNLSQISPYYTPFQPLGLPRNAPVNPNAYGTNQIDDGVYKLQFTHAMGPNAYARVYGYSLYSAWLMNDPNGNGAFVSPDYILPTHTRGLGLTLADQVGNHLLNLTGGYSYARLSRWNDSFPSTSNPVAVLVSSANPTAGCYSATGAVVYCGGAQAARYVIPTNPFAPGAQLTPAATGGITPATASSMSCGGAPCEYLTVGSGLGGSFNDVTPRFANLTVSDTWNVTPKLTLDLAVRYDSFRYDIPSGSLPEGPNPNGASAMARTLFTNSYNAFHCFVAPIGPSGISATTTPNSCPAGTQQIAFSTATPSSVWAGGFQPRLGATFTLNSLNVLRAGYGRYLQPSSSAFQFYNRADPNVAAFDVPEFYEFGFNTPYHPTPPAESWNFDFSWEHQVKGSDMSWKITPFFRRTRNENINVLIDPQTNFVSGVDALNSDIKGFELLFRKGDFSRNGFAMQLAYTYTYEKSRYNILPGGITALDGVNSVVRNYNAYTSFCAAHSTDKRCGSTTTGAAAAPCYAADGTPDPTCAAGSIANPYWNAPVQNLFDRNATYFPFNQTFGTGFSSNASSYNIPHVAALILNYKRDKWNFTPTVQFTAGGRYGSPVQGIGIAPDTGCTPLAGTTAGDPRYPYGAPGGAPYDAQSCPGFITAPNPYTQQFDTPGAFVEPSQLVANLGIGYQANKRLKLNLLAVNVFGTCFGGSKEPWTNYGPKVGCWYGSATGFQAGNFYNPGNPIANQAQPYFPVLGGIAGQQAYGTNIQPLQIFLSAQLKI
jgi:hypothetical protein